MLSVGDKVLIDTGIFWYLSNRGVEQFKKSGDKHLTGVILKIVEDGEALVGIKNSCKNYFSHNEELGINLVPLVYLIYLHNGSKVKLRDLV